jgi:hypothetical protein
MVKDAINNKIPGNHRQGNATVALAKNLIEKLLYRNFLPSSAYFSYFGK